MQESRRGFLKKLGVVTAATAVGVTAVAKDTGNYASDSNGVVVGKSNKKEIIYKKTKFWEEYYNSAQ